MGYPDMDLRKRQVGLTVRAYRQAKAEGVTFNVVELGATPDGKTDSSKSFLDAWTAACGSVVPASIYVPPGRFFIQGLYFNDKCKTKNVLFRIDGVLVAPADFFVTGNMANWIEFREVDGVAISGWILDGQGIGLWNCKLAGKTCPSGATPNVSHCSQWLPKREDKRTQGTTDLWIEKVVCGPGHGISIGSLGKDRKEQGVENVTVKTVTFSGTQNGARIKTWGRPSSGFARNILFQHLTMNNVQNPLVIDQNYCPHKRDCPDHLNCLKDVDMGRLMRLALKQRDLIHVLKGARQKNWEPKTLTDGRFLGCYKKEPHDSYTPTAVKDPGTTSKEQPRHQELSFGARRRDSPSLGLGAPGFTFTNKLLK
ncbi:hypothetical protein AgCh_028646 [Apium graveolens]